MICSECGIVKPGVTGNVCKECWEKDSIAATKRRDRYERKKKKPPAAKKKSGYVGIR